MKRKLLAALLALSLLIPAGCGSSGTGSVWLRGCVCVRSGRFMPFFAINNHLRDSFSEANGFYTGFSGFPLS